MPNLNFTNLPNDFRESNVENLERAAEVIFIKRLRNYVVPGSGETSETTEFKRFQKDFREFLKPGGQGILQSNEFLDSKWIDPDDPTKTRSLYKHYQIIANARFSAGKKSIVDDLSPGVSNSDVLRLSSKTTTEGRGGCEITLNSRGDKYIFVENFLRRNDAVFESNDLVFVNLSGLDGQMHRVFTGLITSANVRRQVGDTLQTTVAVRCEDMLKLLTQSRTNVRPSANSSEAQGTFLTGLSPNFADKLPHEILTFVLSRAYSDLYTKPGFRSELESIRNKAKDKKTRTQAALAEEALINRTLRIPKHQKTVGNKPTPEASQIFIVTEAPEEVAVDSISNRETQFKASDRSIAVPKRVYGFNRMRTKGTSTQSQTTNLMLNEAAQGSLIDFSDPDDIAWVLSGTTQPAYKLSFTGQTSVFASDWRSGLSVCTEIARNLNYEFFADEFGVAWFRPLNVQLPFDFAPLERPRTTAALRDQFPTSARVGSEYWLDEHFIQDEIFTQTDQNIFTIAYVLGDLAAGDLTPGSVRGVAIDVQKFLKLGARVANPITKYNLLSDDACALYAQGHLSRLNGEARTSRIIYTGDSRLQVGNPVYVKHANTIYYIKSVSHDFQVGQRYTTTLELTYGRKPLGTLTGVLLAGGVKDPTLIQQIAKNRIEFALNDLRLRDENNTLINKIDASIRNQADYIQKNQDRLTFQGFVWEIVHPLDYEDLANVLGVQRSLTVRKEVSENALFKTETQKHEVQQAGRRGKTGASAQIDAVKRQIIKRGAISAVKFAVRSVTGL